LSFDYENLSITDEAVQHPSKAKAHAVGRRGLGVSVAKIQRIVISEASSLLP
jgi:hypothetical protein